MSRRLLAAVFPLVLLLACRGTPAPLSPSRPTQASPSSIQSLQRRLSELLSDPAVAAGTWAVDVRSLATDQTLFELNAHRLLTPASTMKLITLAVAADRLGWDYTYETQLVARGSITSGSLDGDLVIVGNGDPALDDWDGVASGVFSSWADRLKELGIQRVAGRVVGDGRIFRGPPLGSGWAWDDLVLSYSAPASGLQFNEGTAQVIVVPAATAGAPATVTVSPSFAPVVLHGSVNTAAPDTLPVWTVERRDAGSPIAIGGTVPAGTGRYVRNVAVERPALYFAEAVRASVKQGGIRVEGGAADAGDADPAPSNVSSVIVATHRSPPLASIADTMMKLSQNLFAESLLRTIGNERGGPNSLEAGRAVERETLASWRIDPSEVLITDGSGLSRYNLVTAHALGSVLAHVYRDERLRGPYVASLPVAGRTGTLQGRLRGTAAEGTVQAKTGSFTNARSVAGFARTPDGDVIAFTILANNYGVASDVVDRVTDGIIVELAGFRR